MSAKQESRENNIWETVVLDKKTIDEIMKMAAHRKQNFDETLKDIIEGALADVLDTPVGLYDDIPNNKRMVRLKVKFNSPDEDKTLNG